MRLIEADMGGRPPLPGGLPESAARILQKSEEIQAQPKLPPRLVTGRDLIDLGYEPGPAFAKLLKSCYDAQLAGEFTTQSEGLEFIKSMVDAQNS